MKQFLITLEDLEKLNGLIKINLRDDDNRTLIKDGINPTKIAYAETMEDAKDYIRDKYKEYCIDKYYKEHDDEIEDEESITKKIPEELMNDILEEYCINMNEANDFDIINEIFKRFRV